jgi:predicted ATPase
MFRRGIQFIAQGNKEEGQVLVRQGLDAYRATGAVVRQPGYFAELAAVYVDIGQPEEGLVVVAEALAHVERTGERWCEADLYRLKGELLLQLYPDNHTKAETCFQQALDIARQQQAKSLELRAAMSLAHLWQQQGKCQEAYDLLAPVYNWFTEGFGTADVQEAKALLDDLA